MMYLSAALREVNDDVDNDDGDSMLKVLIFTMVIKVTITMRR